MKRLPLLALTLVLLLPFAARAEDKEPDHKKTWDATVEKAVKYFRKTQAKDGSWGGNESPGITGIIVTGLIQCGVDKKDPMIENALKYVESQIDPKTGHIAGKAKTGHQNYITCV